MVRQFQASAPDTSAWSQDYTYLPVLAQHLPRFPAHIHCCIIPILPRILSISYLDIQTQLLCPAKERLDIRAGCDALFILALKVTSKFCLDGDVVSGEEGREGSFGYEGELYRGHYLKD